MLTRQAYGSVLLVLQYVEQGVCETGLFFGLAQSVGERCKTWASRAYMFEVELGLLADGGIGIQRVLDTLSQSDDVHDRGALGC